MLIDSEKANESKDLPGSIPDLWSQFRNAAGDDYFHYWLALQSTLIRSTVQGVLVMNRGGADSYEPVAAWPEGGGDFERIAEICESTLEQRSGLLAQLPASGNLPADRTCYAVSYPVLVDTALRGVVALEVVVDSPEELTGCMEQLRWGVSWLELQVRRKEAGDSAQLLSGMKSSFDLLATVLGEEHFTNASMVFVTGLATLLRCDRASLGFVRKGDVRVDAISHSATFGERMNLVRFIAAAMDEAIMQRCQIVFPPPSGGKVLVTRDHEELSRQQSGEAVLTLPLHDNNSHYGALTLERPAEMPFVDEDIRMCRSVLALVAPILEAKRRNDRLLVQKIADSFTLQLTRLLGPGHAGRKLAALGLVGLVLFFSRADGEYRLTATTVLEPQVRRSIVSPFNGFVKEAAVRSGDLVKRGSLMCSLDARDLHLERDRWLNQQVQYQRQRQEAIATSDRAKANIITSQLDQVKAQLDLVQSQLRRTSLVAPFDGIVVSGDLSQRIDGAVEQGEVLFELAPLNAYRVILQVDEYRIADVRQRQRGTLVLPALMDSGLEFEVEKITPISSQREGKNYFRVEARLLKSSDSLRPGMEGVGKISVDRRRLVSIWTRDLVDWVRLKVWSWWP